MVLWFLQIAPPTIYGAIFSTTMQACEPQSRGKGRRAAGRGWRWWYCIVPSWTAWMMASVARSVAMLTIVTTATIATIATIATTLTSYPSSAQRPCALVPPQAPPRSRASFDEVAGAWQPQHPRYPSAVRTNGSSAVTLGGQPSSPHSLSYLPWQHKSLDSNIARNRSVASPSDFLPRCARFHPIRILTKYKLGKFTHFLRAGGGGRRTNRM